MSRLEANDGDVLVIYTKEDPYFDPNATIPPSGITPYRSFFEFRDMLEAVFRKDGTVEVAHGLKEDEYTKLYFNADGKIVKAKHFDSEGHLETTDTVHYGDRKITIETNDKNPPPDSPNPHYLTTFEDHLGSHFMKLKEVQALLNHTINHSQHGNRFRRFIGSRLQRNDEQDVIVTYTKKDPYFTPERGKPSPVAAARRETFFIHRDLLDIAFRKDGSIEAAHGQLDGSYVLDHFDKEGKFTRREIFNEDGRVTLSETLVYDEKSPIIKIESTSGGHTDRVFQTSLRRMDKDFDRLADIKALIQYTVSCNTDAQKLVRASSFLEKIERS